MNNGKSFGALNPNAVPAEVHGTGRSATLTPWEYTRQAGFTYVPTRKVRRRKKGSGIMSEYDSCFRRRSEDLSAYEVSRWIGTGSDSVWVYRKDLSAYEASRWIGTGSDNAWVKKKFAEAFYLRGDIEKFGTGFYRIQMELKDFPDLQFNVEPLNGFMRSELKVLKKDTPQVKELITSIKKEMAREEIQKKLNLKNRKYFRVQYLQPGLAAGVIEMTIPAKSCCKQDNEQQVNQ